MGFYAMGFEVTGKRSAHNSINDYLDQARWEWLHSRVLALVDSPEFERLDITVGEISER
jgi:hypothetical protein